MTLMFYATQYRLEVKKKNGASSRTRFGNHQSVYALFACSLCFSPIRLFIFIGTFI